MLQGGNGLFGVALGVDTTESQLQLGFIQRLGAFQRHKLLTSQLVGVVGPVPEQQVGIL